MLQTNAVDIVLLEEKHFDQVKDIVSKSFPVNETAAMAMDVKPEEYADYLQQCKNQWINQKLSLVAVDSNDQVIGVMLCVYYQLVLLPDDAEVSEKMRTIYDFYAITVEEELEVKNLIPDEIGAIYTLDILVTKIGYEKRGIARKLTEESEKLAKQKGFKLILTEATGPASQSLFKKFDYETILEIPYKDMKGPKFSDQLALDRIQKKFMNEDPSLLIMIKHL